MTNSEGKTMPREKKRTMVCVTVQKTCERLIRHGAALAGSAGLSVVHVARGGEKLLGADSDGEALEYLFHIAREYGAEMDMLRSDDVFGTIIDFARKNNIENIVLGASGARESFGLSERLRLSLPGVSVVIVQ